MPTLVAALYALLAAGLLLASLYRLRLALYRASAPAQDAAPTGQWPRVLVQLPVYNERHVVHRIIDAAARLDYPRELLHIQVLDDSTDSTSAIAAEAVARWRRQGVSIEHLRRGSRAGYKAGALAAGLARDSSELVAIFDADFVPAPDFLRRLVPFFRDPGVGMVQARWEHLNRDDNWLTRAQAVLLDAHFANEHGGRAARGLFFNFNGTAGVWRRACIDDAGGWSSSTLTEDLDLSYRAQLRGWRFVYCPYVAVPAELPADALAFKTQQRRWAKGSIETAKLIVPRLWRQGGLPLRRRLEGTMHLAANTLYLPTLSLALLTPAYLLLRDQVTSPLVWLCERLSVLGTLGSWFVFYVCATLRLQRPQHVLLHLPAVLAVGAGLAVNNVRAVVEALVGRRTAFERTPKRGDQGATTVAPRVPVAQSLAELCLGLYACASLVLSLRQGSVVGALLLATIAGGCLWLALGSLVGAGARAGVDTDAAPNENPAALDGGRVRGGVA